MSDQQDERIGILLRDDAPPERDALFRLAVLERRALQRFRRRSLVLLVAAVALALIFGLGINAGAGLFAASAITLLAGALATAAAFSIRGVRELMHRLGAIRGAAKKI